MFNKCNSTDGFTLVELVICLFLISIILSSVYSLYFFSMDSFYRDLAEIDIQHNVRHAMDYIINLLYNASDSDVVIKKTTKGATYLIIRDKFFDLQDNTLRVEHNYDGTGFPIKNPLSEEIVSFEASKNDKLVTVTISGKHKKHDKCFTLTSKVRLKD